MKVLARDLGVSYPTARLRYTELLGRLGIAEVGGIGGVTEPVDREDVLRRLATGELDLDEATELLR